MSYFDLDPFARDELLRVDQEKFYDELYVLRHSPAARQIFAKAQWYATIGEDEFFRETSVLFEALGVVALEVAHAHPWAYHRLNPSRKWVPGVGKFRRLANELGYEEDVRYGDTYVRTILGYWKV